MDARRFSTGQGRPVEKSRQRSGPAMRSIVGAQAGGAFFAPGFFAQAKKGGSRPFRGTKAFASAGAVLLCLERPTQDQGQDQGQDQELSLPCGERVTFLCLCKEKLTKRKHTLPPRPRCCASRVHSAGRIFRRDVLVSSKNAAHPCASPRWGLVCQLRRCGREPGKSKSTARAMANGKQQQPSKRTQVITRNNEAASNRGFVQELRRLRGSHRVEARRQRADHQHPAVHQHEQQNLERGRHQHR